MKRIFYRNVDARDMLELFLLSAVTSLLLVRFYLHLSGYPQLGAGGLHIAHMLWGGLMMLVAIVLSLSFLGARMLRLVAALGGIGFGVFIDELGKFITRDNNYFYAPTVGIIYAFFVVLYLSFNFLSRGGRYTSREYQLNALVQLEEAIVHDMDPLEKERVAKLLADAESSDPVTRRLQQLLHDFPTIPLQRPGRLQRWQAKARDWYEALWQEHRTGAFVRIFFLFEVLLFVVGSIWTLSANLDGVFDALGGHIRFPLELVMGQLLSSLVAAGFAVWGVVLLPRSYLSAYEQFRRATLVNIFLTQIFMFLRTEFAALPGFLFNLVLLFCIGYAIRRRPKRTTARRPAGKSATNTAG